MSGGGACGTIPRMAQALARFRQVQPAVVARCASAADVAAALARARDAELPVAVRGGGHCFAGTSSTAGLLIDLSALSGIRVEREHAVIGGGATLGAVYDALDAQGRTLNAGCGTTVGVGGLALGGGLGILGRVHGLLSDSLRSAEVVLASGAIVRTEADEDLLWALRGAGQARFGVVTELTFATVAPPPSTAFELHWAPEALPAVLGAWQHWAPDAPDAMAASLVVTAAERVLVRVFGAMAGSEAETSAALNDLCTAAGVPPRGAVHHAGSFREVKRFLAGEDAVEDEPMWCKSEYFAGPLPDRAAEALAALVGARPDGVVCELDFSPWAGGYARVAADATAFAHRDARFLLKPAVTVPAGTDPAPAREWLAAAYAITHPYGTGGAYPNFPDTDLDAWDPGYHLGNRERLLTLKRRYDRDGLLGPLPRSVE
jgi:FAD/FMN-containing dehydrogenase